MKYLIIMCVFVLNYSSCNREKNVEYFCSEETKNKITDLEKIIEFGFIKNKVACNYEERFFYAYIKESNTDNYDTISFIESPKPYTIKDRQSNNLLGFKKYSDIYVFYLSDDKKCNNDSEMIKTLGFLRFNENIDDCIDIINSSFYIYDDNYNFIKKYSLP